MGEAAAAAPALAPPPPPPPPPPAACVSKVVVRIAIKRMAVFIDTLWWFISLSINQFRNACYSTGVQDPKTKSRMTPASCFSFQFTSKSNHRIGVGPCSGTAVVLFVGPVGVRVLLLLLSFIPGWAPGANPLVFAPRLFVPIPRLFVPKPPAAELFPGGFIGVVPAGGFAGLTPEGLPAPPKPPPALGPPTPAFPPPALLPPALAAPPPALAPPAPAPPPPGAPLAPPAAWLPAVNANTAAIETAAKIVVFIFLLSQNVARSAQDLFDSINRTFACLSIRV